MASRGEPRQPGALLLVGRPAQQRVDDEGVLDVDEHADRRVDPREFLDDQDRVEERAAAAAEPLGHLDAHQPHVEQSRQQRRVHACALVHATRAWREFLQGELAHALAEQPLVLGQRGQGRGQVDSRRGHGDPHGSGGRGRPGGHGRASKESNPAPEMLRLRASLRRRARIVMLSSLLRMIRPGFRSAVVFLTLSATLVGAAAQQSSAPAGQTRPAQPVRAPAGAAARAAAGRRCRAAGTAARRRTRTRRPHSRPSARASTSSASTRSSPTSRDARSPT